MPTALLLSLLTATSLPARADVDPEPPQKKGIMVRLVAKKSTYKLDLGGKKKEDFVADARAGTAAPPSVDLELVITNYTNETIRIRTTGSTNRMTLKLEGDWAIDAPGMMVNVPPGYST